MSTDPLIRPARADEVDAVADSLAAAFAEEPYFTAVFGRGPDASRRSRELFVHQLRHQYLPHGVVDVAELDGRVAGVGLWAPPGSAAGSLPAQLRLLPTYARLTGRRFPRAVVAEVAGMRVHPSFPHWYLYMLGTAPEARGRGVGGRLLEHRLGRLPADAAVYLEASTDASARLYARHGFVRLGPVPMGGGRSIHGMWRPAAPPAA